MEKHFVTFLSPGTLVAESTTKEIDSWDVDRAVEMSAKIKERYGATPYGFYFTTRARGPEDFESREVNKSGIYYLGGEVLTLADIEAQNDPKNDILISNMRGNGWDRIVINNNSYKWAQPLQKTDVVLDIKDRRTP